MIVSAIVALSENRAIGKGGGLPWHLPDDLKRFRKITMGHPIIMGRKTWESIGRKLPGRTMIVVTRNPRFSARDVLVAHSLEQALELAGDQEEVFVIGGASLFRAALPLIERFYVTLVHAEVEGDVFLPEGALDKLRLRSDEHHPADERHPHAFTFQVYERA